MSLISEIKKALGRSWFGKHRGIVKDNQDPMQLGRIRCYIPRLHGLNKALISNWALPSTPFGGSSEVGMVFLPELESTVWIEFEPDESGMPDTRKPIWSGCFWVRADGTPETPIEALEDQPTDGVVNRVIKTKAGHLVELQDKEGEEYIKITDKAGNVLILDSTSGAEKIEVEHISGTKVTMDEDCAITVVGDTTIRAGGKVDISAASEVIINADVPTASVLIGNGLFEILDANVVCPLVGKHIAVQFKSKV